MVQNANQDRGATIAVMSSVGLLITVPERDPFALPLYSLAANSYARFCRC